MSTRLEDIYAHLKSKDFDVYLPGQHKGDCISSYVVVKPGVVTEYLSFSSNICYYELLCYTPEKYPTQMESYKERVKAAMLSLSPMIKFVQMETQPYHDEQVKAWMVDLTYRNIRKVDSELFQQLDINNQNN